VRLLQLGNAVLARLDLRELARPHLQMLVEETGETATLSAPGDPDAVTVDFVLSESTVQSVARVGRPSICHATATGKVMLAFTGSEPRPGSMKAYTKRTITNRDRLAAELERIRRVGWAEASGEREEHLNAIAAPVFGAHGELAAIMGVQGPGLRFNRDAMRAAVEPLIEHTETVSVALGYVIPD
jgi:IclR family acetate operon transcriptional repressor